MAISHLCCYGFFLGLEILVKHHSLIKNRFRSFRVCSVLYNELSYARILIGSHF